MQAVGDVADRTPGSQRFVLDNVDEFHSQRRTIAEVRREHLGAKRRTQDDASDPGLTSSSDLMRGAGHARDRQHRLGCVYRERAQSSPLTTHEQYGFMHADTLAYGPGRCSRYCSGRCDEPRTRTVIQ